MDFTFWGWEFTWLGTFTTQMVETVVFRAPSRQAALGGWTIPAALALADFDSDFDLDLINQCRSKDLSTDDLADTHTYLTPDG